MQRNSNNHIGLYEQAPGDRRNEKRTFNRKKPHEGQPFAVAGWGSRERDS